MSFSIGSSTRPGGVVRVLREAASSPRRMAMAVIFVFGVSSVFALAAPSATYGWDTNSFSTSSASTLVTLTNRARANAGLKSLKVSSTLASVARWRSKDMITRDYFSHTIPGYGKVWDKLHAIGYCYKVAGENIGWNNYPDDVATAAIQDMFMGSPGHRANILGKTWDVIGIGAYKGPTGKKMWTVLFADQCGTAPKPTPKPTARPRPKATARPTARPTAKPTAKPSAPKATPVPTPTLAPLGTAPLDESDLIPSDDQGDLGVTEATESPGDEPAENGAGGAAIRMRVIDRPPNGGLLDTIVGGVTGFFFGG
jgi:uncharacterized protein YkwD